MSKAKKPPAKVAPAPAAAAASPPEPEEVKAEEVKEEPPSLLPQYNENQQRVLFTRLPIKSIVSFHSGSILAENDPVPIEISTKQLIELKNVFAANATMMTIPVSSTASDQPISFFQKSMAFNSTPLSTNVVGTESEETLSEVRITTAQLLNMILKLHANNCATMNLDKYFLQEVIDFYLPPCKNQSPPPPPVAAAPAPATAPAPAPAKGKAAPPPVVEPVEPVPTPGIPSDGVIRVSTMNETEFLSWYEKYFADPFFYGQRMRLSAGRGLLKEVKQLLYRQCNINTANGEGITSLHYACEFNRVDIVDLLYAVGGKALLVNAQDKHGWTPLHSAVHYGNIACVKRLLEFPETMLETADCFGKTVLHCAITQNRGSIAFLLLEKGLDMLAKDVRGLTPLHEAAYRGHISLYNELVQEYKNRHLYDEVSQLQDELGRRPADYLA